jgi:hypothetical protein
MKDTETPTAVKEPAKMEVLAPAVVDKAFLELLTQHRRGECLDELSQGLRELNAAVELTGKGGIITLRIAIKPNGGIKRAVQIKDDIKLTLPKLDKGASLFYVNKDGALQREDPDQTHLDLRVVKGGPNDGSVELRRIS